MKNEKRNCNSIAETKTTKNPKLSLRLLTAKENADKIRGIHRDPATFPYPFLRLWPQIIYGASRHAKRASTTLLQLFTYFHAYRICVPYVGGCCRILMYFVGCWDWNLQSDLVGKL